MSDFFSSSFGLNGRVRWRRYFKLLRVADAMQDVVECALGIRARAERRARALPRQRVLIAAVEVPGREADLARVIAGLRRSRHETAVATIAMRPQGKMANINAAISPFALDTFDWLLVVDDDIEFAPGFLDLLLAEAAHRGFLMAMPAHRQLSFSTFKVTRRHWAAASRRTGFVEVGPVTLLHRSVLADLVPFPEHRWAWGIDVYWANHAARRGWAMGIVDVAAVRHLRPVGASYPRYGAEREAAEFLRDKGADLPKTAILRNFAHYH